MDTGRGFICEGFITIPEFDLTLTCNKRAIKDCFCELHHPDKKSLKEELDTREQLYSKAIILIRNIAKGEVDNVEEWCQRFIKEVIEEN